MRESVTASLITQGEHKFYTLTLPIETIAACCSPNPRAEDPVAGFQRTLDEKRAEDIADYLQRGGVIPSSIILSAQDNSNFEYSSKNKSISFDVSYKSFLIIDGQHRVYGFRKLVDKSTTDLKIRIPVVIFTNLTPVLEARMFIDVNTLQRPVPKELLLDIKKLAETENQEEELLDLIFTKFETESNSNLLNKLSRFEKKKNMISKVTFYDAFRPLLKYFSINNPDKLFEIINAYLNAAEDILTSQRVDYNSLITKSISFKILISHCKPVITMISDLNPDGLTKISEHKKLLQRSLTDNIENILNSRTQVKSIETLDKRLLKRNLII